MGAYLIRRLLLVVPTLFGIIAINFVVVQFAPGGPVEQMIAELRGHGGTAIGRVSGPGGAEVDISVPLPEALKQVLDQLSLKSKAKRTGRVPDRRRSR